MSQEFPAVFVNITQNCEKHQEKSFAVASIPTGHKPNVFAHRKLNNSVGYIKNCTRKRNSREQQ